MTVNYLNVKSTGGYVGGNVSGSLDGTISGTISNTPTSTNLGQKEIDQIIKLLSSNSPNFQNINSILNNLIILNKDKLNDFTLSELFNLSLLSSIANNSTTIANNSITIANNSYKSCGNTSSSKTTKVINTTPTVNLTIEPSINPKLLKYLELYGSLDNFDEGLYNEIV